eukprot:3591730-Pleurochrysis_carterae.AAC.2
MHAHTHARARRLARAHASPRTKLTKLARSVRVRSCPRAHETDETDARLRARTSACARVRSCENDRAQSRACERHLVLASTCRHLDASKLIFCTHQTLIFCTHQTLTFRTHQTLTFCTYQTLTLRTYQTLTFCT